MLMRVRVGRVRRRRRGRRGRDGKALIRARLVGVGVVVVVVVRLGVGKNLLRWVVYRDSLVGKTA